MATFTDTRTFVIESCITCGIDFGVPESFQERCQKVGESKTYFCPNGHGQIYREGDVEKLKRKLKDVESRLANREFELMAERNSHEATRKKSQRLEKRVKNGACPCCHRQFVNLHRHMETKHPEFAEA